MSFDLIAPIRFSYTRVAGSEPALVSDVAGSISSVSVVNNQLRVVTQTGLNTETIERYTLAVTSTGGGGGGTPSTSSSVRGNLWVETTLTAGALANNNALTVTWETNTNTPSTVTPNGSVLNIPYLKPSENIFGIWVVVNVAGNELHEILIPWASVSDGITKANLKIETATTDTLKIVLKPIETQSTLSIYGVNGITIPSTCKVQIYPAIVQSSGGGGGGDTGVQSDWEVTDTTDLAYINHKPTLIAQLEAEAGIATTERLWSAERIKQAIVALAPSSGGADLDFSLPGADLTKHITFIVQEHTDASNSFVTLTTASGGIFNQTHAPLAGSISPALPILTYASFNNIQNGQIILYFDRTLMDAAFTRIPNWVKIHLGSRTINLPNATNTDPIFGYEYKTFAQGNMDAYIGEAISNVRFEFPGNIYYPARISESNEIKTTTKNDLETVIVTDIAGNKADTDLENVRDDLTDTQKTDFKTKLDITDTGGGIDSVSALAPITGEGIAGNPLVLSALGVQSDWNQSDNTNIRYIRNKPEAVTSAEAVAGTETDVKLWSPFRVNQAIAALASSGGSDILVSNNSQDPPDSVGANGQLLFRTTDDTLWFKTGGTWHVVGRVPIEVTQAEAEAGTLTEVRHWTPQRVNQAIQALASSGGTTVTANPSGTDGDDLDRIAIGGTNYNISGGGGEETSGTETIYAFLEEPEDVGASVTPSSADTPTNLDVTSAMIEDNSWYRFKLTGSSGAITVSSIVTGAEVKASTTADLLRLKINANSSISNDQFGHDTLSAKITSGTLQVWSHRSGNTIQFQKVAGAQEITIGSGGSSGGGSSSGGSRYLGIEELGESDEVVLPINRTWVAEGVRVPEGVHILFADIGSAHATFEVIDWDFIADKAPGVAGEVSTPDQYDTIVFQSNLNFTIRIGRTANNEILLASHEGNQPITIPHLLWLAPLGGGSLTNNFINDLNIGSLDKDAEFVFNKHVPSTPHYLYSTNQELTFQRDGSTTTYDINLPPPDAPRRAGTVWGSAGTQAEQQIWSARLSATTNGFMSFDLRHQGEAQPQMLEFESEETGAFKGTFPTNEHTDSASVTFLNNSYPTEHWRQYFFLEYFFKDNIVQPGFVPTHLVFFDSSGEVEIELPLQRDNPDGDDLLSYWYWTSTAVTTNYTEAQLEALRMDIRVQNGTYLFHRPDPTSLFTSTDISTLNNNDEVTLDKINRVDLGQDDADKNFYLQGHKRVHSGNNYLRLTLFNDADLSDQSGINDLRPNGYVASSGQSFLINFKSEDQPAESQNRKTTFQTLATSLSEVLTPRERRLQNELNILSQLTSQLSISGRSPTETVAITNGLALFSERPTAAVMQAASYATTVPHAVTNEHKFIGLKLSFDTDKNRTQILITEDGQTIPESLFNGGALIEVATTDSNFAYYYIELRHVLQLEGTLSATISTSQVTQTEFTGRTRHPFRVTSLPLASADYTSGEVIRLVNPQGPFQGEASITFGDNGLYYGYATRAIPNFVTEDIGSSSISLDSSLYGILVEKSARSQIYVIGNSSDFTNSLTHLLVGQTSYPLSNSVMVSGTTHFKIVEDVNGNPLRNDDSPLNDVTENDTRDISVRRIGNEYIGGATPTFEVGNYERQLTASTDLDDIWSPVALLHTTAEKARDYEFMLENLSNHYRKDRDIPGARLFLSHTRGFSDETLGNLSDVPSEFPDEIHVMTWHNDISNPNENHRFKIEVVEDSGESNRAYHGKTFVFNGREHTLSYYQRSNNRNRYHTAVNSQTSDPGSTWRNVNIENIDFEAHEAFQDARAWVFHRGTN